MTLATSTTAPSVRQELEMRIVSILDVTSAVRLFRLERPAGGGLPQASAGAHIDVEVIIAGRREWRSYSLINQHGQTSFYEFAVQREDTGRGGSKYLHNALNVEDIVRVRAPQNNFPLSDQADRYLLVAGGIGVTPIYSIAQELVARGTDVRVVFCARTERDAPFLNDMQKLLGDRLLIHADEGNPTKFFDFGKLVSVRRPGEHIYMCGPNPLMARLVDLCSSNSWPPAAVHRETFDPTKGEVSSSFIVHLARTGGTVIVRDDVSLLDALIEAGHEPLYDCRRGECGLCVVDYVKGEVLHRDSFLSAEDKRDKICTCVSRAANSEITLDI